MFLFFLPKYTSSLGDTTFSEVKQNVALWGNKRGGGAIADIWLCVGFFYSPLATFIQTLSVVAIDTIQTKLTGGSEWDASLMRHL